MTSSNDASPGVGQPSRPDPDGSTGGPRLARALRSLQALALGDCFGERFFGDDREIESAVIDRKLPHGPWRWTDDTAMALAVTAVLARGQGVDQDALAAEFGACYDPKRGFSTAMHRLLPALAKGRSWRELAPGLFDGKGSYGNGAAMRVAPIGAYWCDDLDRVAEAAATQAKVTHAHPEGVAGAIAVGIAAAISARHADQPLPERRSFLTSIQPHIPSGLVADGVATATELPGNTSVRKAAAVLGNGTRLSAMDTVPFALWCAARHLGDLTEALWATVSGLGDRDTTCAIVGGVVGARCGTGGVPASWLVAREPLPEWVEQLSGEG